MKNNKEIFKTLGLVEISGKTNDEKKAFAKLKKLVLLAYKTGHRDGLTDIIKVAGEQAVNEMVMKV